MASCETDYRKNILYPQCGKPQLKQTTLASFINFASEKCVRSDISAHFINGKSNKGVDKLYTNANQNAFKGPNNKRIVSRFWVRRNFFLIGSCNNNTHILNMKAKQGGSKEDNTLERGKEAGTSNAEAQKTLGPGKRRARRKLSGIEPVEDKNEPKSTVQPMDKAKGPGVRRVLQRGPKKVIQRRAILVTKTIRNKKALITKDNIKTTGRQVPARNIKKTQNTKQKKSQEEPAKTNNKNDSQDGKANERIEIATPEPGPSEAVGSRSCSPKSTTFARRQRLSSDLLMMKSLLGDSPTSVVNKSPYSTRSDRSKSPLVIQSKEPPPMKTLRNGKQRKQKVSLLSETVEQAFKRRRRLLSDSKVDPNLDIDDKLKKRRVRSFSRDGSEISKGSDFTESDLSFCDTMSVDTDSGKQRDPKDTTVNISKDLKVESESGNVENISLIENNIDLNTLVKLEPLDVIEKTVDEKRRSISLDSENNNAAKNKTSIKVEIGVSTADININDRSLILDNMSKAFNESPLSKIRRSKRQRKSTVKAKEQEETVLIEKAVELDISKEIKQETVDTASVEDKIDDALEVSEAVNIDNNSDSCTLSVSQFRETDSLTDKLKIENPISIGSTIESKLPSEDVSIINDECSKKSDDVESLRLQIDDEDEDDEKTEESSKENIESLFSATNHQSREIDILMDKLRTFEEQDRKRHQEMLAKSASLTPMMVTNDVVLIAKSGAEIKPLKDIQSTVQSVEMVDSFKPMDKESVFSCFENNSAISIVKKDHIRKSTEKDHMRKSIDKEQHRKSTELEQIRKSNDREQMRRPPEKDSIRKSTDKEHLRKSTEKDYVRNSLEIDLPSSITLIPRTGGSRKQSTNSNTNETFSFLEKTLGKDVTFEIRKSIDKIPAVEVPACSLKCNLSNTLPKQTMDVTTAAIVTPALTSEVSITLKEFPLLLTQPVDKTKEEQSATAIKELQNAISVSLLFTQDSPDAVLIDKKDNEDLVFKDVSQGKKAVKKPPECIEETVLELENAIPSTSAILAQREPPLPALIQKEFSSVPSTQNEPLPTAPIQRETTPVPTHRVSPSIASTHKEAFNETPENQKQKENILRTLGLLTLKEADETKIEKLKQKELLATKATKSNLQKINSNDVYTGTLKTVIKLNRVEKKKQGRTSLKMTFQKSKGRPAKHVLEGISGDSDSDDNPYYTIHKEFGDPSLVGNTSADHASSGGHRKSHYSNRFNNHDPSFGEAPGEIAAESGPGKESVLNLVIPEKASSFSIHPGRLCQDQCFYCGGKFGLFDTPCHVAQIKSTERQRKILDNEEKLTEDSCLCDACYRHVDRRANCPSYRKRLAPSVPPLSIGEGGLVVPVTSRPPGSICHAERCSQPAMHSIRRKWLLKMRKSVSKVVTLELDYPGLHTIPLCQDHYLSISRLMVCGLCTRRLSKNHIHFVNQEYPTLNPLLEEKGIPVKFEEKTLVCKLCRYFCTLLLKPPLQPQVNKKAFLKSHRKRLLHAHNLEIPDEPESDQADEEKDYVEDDKNTKDPLIDEINSIKEKKVTKIGKTKSKKSSESSRHTDDNSSDSNKEKRKGSQERERTEQSMDEDIESLISSNKIPIPGTACNSKASDAVSLVSTEISDNSDVDMLVDFEGTVVPTFDKQSELQYLLQKQNTPSAYLKGAAPNLTQKSKNILKVQNSSITNRTLNQKVLEKNAKRIQKLGQIITQRTDTPSSAVQKPELSTESTTSIHEKPMKEIPGLNILRNMALNDECTIESIPSKSAKVNPDINLLKNKWQMSESFTQVKKNLNELSKNLSSDQIKKRPSHDNKYSNPVRRLETNPSISVRELFPGEEEMNLHCNIEFNNVKAVTNEGWEKCNSTIQYDKDTKKLWQDLQKPYGNQSSFMRHLILLEKYFRSGDLVLSQNANYNASTYSESVQSRLRAYDNIPSNSSNSNQLSARLLAAKANPAVTITPQTIMPETLLETAKKPESNSSLIEFRKQKPSVTGKSLLKTNNNTSEMIKNPSSIMMSKGLLIHQHVPENILPIVNQAKLPKNVPMSLAQLTQRIDSTLTIPKLHKNMPVTLTSLEKMTMQLSHANNSCQGTSRPPTPKPEFKSIDSIRPLFPLPSSLTIESKMVPTKMEPPKVRTNLLPPELIAINSQNSSGRKSIENVLKNIQQLAKNAGAASQPIISAAQSPIIHTAPIATSSPHILPPAAVTQVSLPQPTLPAAVFPALPPSQKPSTSVVDDEKPVPIKGPATKKTKTTKPWRPTLIPITDESKAIKISHDVLYQTADGRRLPSLVQVMSGGKPYHITIQDYNKMCIMRREKLQQMQKAELSKDGTPMIKSAKQSGQLEVPIEQISSADCANSTSGKLATTTCESLANPDNKSQEASNSTTTISNSVKPGPSKIENNDRLGDINPISIIKNVGLKNITIAPITAASMTDNKVKSTTIGPSPQVQSLLITANPLLPPVIAQLGPSVSVTTETVPKSSVTSTKVQLSTNQTLPKIPRSLTVIPQTVLVANTESLSPPAVPMMPPPAITSVAGYPSMAIMPLPAFHTQIQKP